MLINIKLRSGQEEFSHILQQGKNTNAPKGCSLGLDLHGSILWERNATLELHQFCSDLLRKSHIMEFILIHYKVGKFWQHTSESMYMLIWGCHGECEEVNSSSAKKRLELPSLYIYANPQMLRHKLITQPSNLFPSRSLS